MYMGQYIDGPGVVSVIERVQHKERYSGSHLSAAVCTEARGSTTAIQCPCTPVHLEGRSCVLLTQRTASYREELVGLSIKLECTDLRSLWSLIITKLEIRGRPRTHLEPPPAADDQPRLGKFIRTGLLLQLLLVALITSHTLKLLH